MIKKFSIPNYYRYTDAIISLYDYMRIYPQYFYSDRIIDSTYDYNPSIKLWTGGRDQYEPLSNLTIEQILNKYSFFPNLSLRHVCTNCLIDNNLIHDYSANYFLTHYMRPQDKIIVNSSILIDYLKQVYPQINLIYSTTLGLTDIEKINKITEENIYVLNYNYNYDNNYLSQLKHPKNIEILCAEPCPLHCPNRTKHYQYISKIILGLDAEKFSCESYGETTNAINILNLPHVVTNERIDELATMGFQYFKISGRTLRLPSWLEVILYYLVLPEHKDYVRNELLNSWW